MAFWGFWGFGVFGVLGLWGLGALGLWCLEVLGALGFWVCRCCLGASALVQGLRPSVRVVSPYSYVRELRGVHPFRTEEGLGVLQP